VIESLRTWTLLRELRAKRSREELEALQGRLLRAAVRHAYENVPFYRRRWDDAGFDAPGFEGDLARIPVSDSGETRTAIERGELFAADADLSQARTFQTNGSSGRSLRVPRGTVEQRLWRAMGLRAWLEHGFRWTDVTLRFDSQSGPDHFLQRAGISRTVWVSNEQPLEERVRQLVATAPQVVVGTPTVLRRVCALLEADSSSLPPPRIVFSQGEILDSRTRATIERALGTQPFDLYGATEVGYVAWQCEQRQALHVNAEAYVVEVLRDSRPADPGEVGRVVITDLRGRTMPLLRYDTGDLAVAGEEHCACGRALPLLGRMEGRARASLSRPDGGVVTTREVIEGVALPPDRFRVHQERDGAVRLEVVPGEDGAAAAASLAALVGQAEVGVSATLREPLADAQKAQPVRSSVPLRLP
jgi:phenylacetate-coenzyme A ligase PaaK-like adenylate-forming protein